MVRERVGDWRLAWRFALAGLVAGLLVITLAQTGVTAGTFDAGQDTLFPAPSPDPQITFVALDSRSQRTLGAYPWNNSYHAQVINYLAGLHPKAILFDIVLDHLTGNSVEPPFEATDPQLTQAIRAAGNVVLVCNAESAPRPEFSTVAAAVGDRGLGVADRANAVRGLILRPAPDATCAENETDEPAFLLALRISEKITAPLTVRDSVATFGTHRIPVEQGQMLINFSRGSSPSCSYVDAFNSACPQPDLITDHIVVVGTKLIDAGDIYGQAVSFPTMPASVQSTGRAACWTARTTATESRATP